MLKRITVKGVEHITFRMAQELLSFGFDIQHTDRGVGYAKNQDVWTDSLSYVFEDMLQNLFFIGDFLEGDRSTYKESVLFVCAFKRV